MSPEQIHLLKSLGSGVRPVDLGEVSGDQDDRFDRMLREAVGGRASTQLGVKFSPSVSGMYDQQQQHSIARAIDLAAAAGSEHALILHERHTLRVDVRNRVVLEAPAIKISEAVTGIDAFVKAQAGSDGDEDDGLAQRGPGVFSPARVVRNPSLVRALADYDTPRDP
ncbi:MAG: hypothetical protein ACX94C_03340 [Phycisphaerales bacterium]